MNEKKHSLSDKLSIDSNTTKYCAAILGFSFMKEKANLECFIENDLKLKKTVVDEKDFYIKTKGLDDYNGANNPDLYTGFIIGKSFNSSDKVSDFIREETLKSKHDLYILIYDIVYLDFDKVKFLFSNQKKDSKMKKLVDKALEAKKRELKEEFKDSPYALYYIDSVII